jgi:hypothetical protein
MDQLLIGIVLALVGLLLCFAGLRLWYVLLPLLAAILGFYLGAKGIENLIGTGFLATAFAWFGGLVLAVGFAILSWFFWYAGVMFLTAVLGAMLASGMVHAFTDTPPGWVLFIVSVLGAVVGFWLALALQLPTYLVVIASAVVGAALAVAGALTIAGTITIAELSNGVAYAVIDEIKFQGVSWLWGLGWLVLALGGAVVQLQGQTETVLPESRWVRARTG